MDNEKEKVEDVIETSDLALAAALMTFGGVLERTEVDCSDARHIRLKVRGDGLKKIEFDWQTRQGDARLLRDYSGFFKDVKAFIHTVGDKR